MVYFADFNNDLVGIQPLCKHVPPNKDFSTIATFLPNCEALIAATYPAVPPPRTTKSYCFLTWSYSLNT